MISGTKWGDRVISTHHFILTPKSNGQESLTFNTEFWNNGDKGEKGLLQIHSIALQSYGNEAMFIISHEITPEILRELANQLDVARLKAISENS